MSLSARRAWIEILINIDPDDETRSLSARRAWIEIPVVVSGGSGNSVALRKESVDRNKSLLQHQSTLSGSLSARRAWIEILAVRPGVDPGGSRSPQGERG